VTRQSATARRAEELLGTPVVATAPVAGGDICTATRLKLSDGRSVLMKTLSPSPEGFFAAEARGLRWLAEASDEAVPEVLAVDQDCLVLPWIEPGRATPDAAAAFGRVLARVHAAGAEEFGALPDGYIGRLPLPNASAPTWGEFFATRRVLPYLRLAQDRGAVTGRQAAVVESVAGRLDDLVPGEPPARLHGDLWNGNVLWGNDGAVRMVDPAAHAGHRETDLAMLGLFGLPHLQRALDAYDEATPLVAGWEERLGLHQLFPLLVHAAMFGGGYGARAATLAARY
jgi:fructosamine-3-kinase